MNIKVLSDSTCDLSKPLLEKYNITLVPLTVVKDGVEYTDGETITPSEIYAHVAAGGSLCSTAAGGIGRYQEAFARFAQDYDGIIHINIGSGFSSSYQNACLAAADFPNVRVIDSQTLSSGQGQVVLKACQLAAECDDLDDLAEKVREFTSHVEISFLLDRLDYMVKGGRCSSATALGANLLNLKPCIEVRDGKMIVVKKYRGNYAKCLVNYVSDRLHNRQDLVWDRLFITHAPISDECYNAVTKAVAEYGHFDEVIDTEVGCTVACHCGPGTLGIIYVRK